LSFSRISREQSYGTCCLVVDGVALAEKSKEVGEGGGGGGGGGGERGDVLTSLKSFGSAYSLRSLASSISYASSSAAASISASLRPQQGEEGEGGTGAGGADFKERTLKAVRSLSKMTLDAASSMANVAATHLHTAVTNYMNDDEQERNKRLVERSDSFMKIHDINSVPKGRSKEDQEITAGDLEKQRRREKEKEARRQSEHERVKSVVETIGDTFESFTLVKNPAPAYPPPLKRKATQQDSFF